MGWNDRVRQKKALACLLNRSKERLG